MRKQILILALGMLPAVAQIKSGPPLPYQAEAGWAKLPPGWNFGEVAAVDVDNSVQKFVK